MLNGRSRNAAKHRCLMGVSWASHGCLMGVSWASHEPRGLGTVPAQAPTTRAAFTECLHADDAFSSRGSAAPRHLPQRRPSEDKSIQSPLPIGRGGSREVWRQHRPQGRPPDDDGTRAAYTECLLADDVLSSRGSAAPRHIPQRRPSEYQSLQSPLPRGRGGSRQVWRRHAAVAVFRRFRTIMSMRSHSAAESWLGMVWTRTGGERWPFAGCRACVCRRRSGCYGQREGEPKHCG